MWLHSLKSKTEEAAAFTVDLSILRDYPAFHVASGPEGMSHGSPRVLGVCPIIACAILSAHKARSRPYELEIDNAVLICDRLDRVGAAVLGQLEGEVICEEGILFLIEAVIRERIRRPKRRLLLVRIEYLAVELAGDPQAPST